MAPAAPAPRPAQRARRATVRVFNETDWPIVVVTPGGGVLPPGEDTALLLARAAKRTLMISCQGQLHYYALDFGLLGFDTVHVRAADLAPLSSP